jgi:hypothetical protein
MEIPAANTRRGYGVVLNRLFAGIGAEASSADRRPWSFGKGFQGLRGPVRREG